MINDICSFPSFDKLMDIYNYVCRFIVYVLNYQTENYSYAQLHVN